MKINEVTSKQLDEGPIDFAKKAWAGTKGLAQGGFAGAKAGWQQQGAANAQQDKINGMTSSASKDWAATAQNIQTSTGNPPKPADAVAWFKQWSGGQNASAAPAGTNPAQIQQWLQKEVAGYLLKNSSGPAQTNPATGGAGNTGGGQQSPSALEPFLRGAGMTQSADAVNAYNRANAKGGTPSADDAEAAGQAQPGADQAQAQAQQGGDQTQQQPADAQPTQEKPAQPDAGAVFKDPNAFKAEWDKFVAAKSQGGAPYQLIADPKLLQVLKNIWMRSGGTQAAESKKTKGKRV